MTFHFTRTAFLNHFEFPALFWRARNRRGKVKKVIQEVFYATLVTFLKKGKLQSKILKQKKKAVLIDIFDSSKQHSRSNQYSNNEKRKLRPSPIFYFQIVSSVIHLAPAKILKSKNCRISCQKDQISRVQSHASLAVLKRNSLPQYSLLSRAKNDPKIKKKYGKVGKNSVKSIQMAN